MGSKTYFYVMLFMAFLINVNAQNLVPNYSFESKLTCPNNYAEFTGYVANWTGQNTGGGLCFFTGQCPGDFPVSVPYNGAGFQMAHSGNSYAGMEIFVNTGPDTSFPYKTNTYKDFRNYIEVKLLDSLRGGSKYFVTFFVNLGDSSNYACNDIGAYISDSSLSFSGYLVKSYITPQVSNNPIKNPLTDTLKWIKVSGGFVAKGGEKYIIIGNFKNDSLSNINYMGKRSVNQSLAFYYIDDVIVSPDSNYADSLFNSINDLSNEFGKKNVYPNPNTGNFKIDLTEESEKTGIEVYNQLGKRVFQTSGIRPHCVFSIDISTQPSGIYYYRITTDKTAVTSGKIIILH